MNDLNEKASDIADQVAARTDKVKKGIIATLEQGQKTIEKQKQRFSEALDSHSGKNDN